MNALMNASQPQTMTSKQIAVVVEKRHDNVKRTIENLANQGVISFTQIEETSHQGAGARPVAVYVVSERDSYIIVAQLCPEYTAKLVDYWMATKSQSQAITFDITNPAHLLQAIEVQARLNIQLAAERDHAIATKAQIGSQREATAMATASAAVRKANAIEAKLGRCISRASILAVQNATGASYGWHPLKAYCTKNNLPQVKAHDERWGKVNTYPAEAWLAVYGVDIVALFGEVAA